MGVCVLEVATYQNAHSTRKVRTILKNEDIFVGSSQISKGCFRVKTWFQSWNPAWFHFCIKSLLSPLDPPDSCPLNTLEKKGQSLETTHH